jgi:flagellar protein FlgJ
MANIIGHASSSANFNMNMLINGKDKLDAISNAKAKADAAGVTTTASAPSKADIDKAAALSAKTDKAAQDFEAVYISEMLKPMFETVDVDDTFGGGKGEEVFRGMLTQEMGKSIAKQGGFGLANQVKAELLKIQEHQSSAAQ